jgi:voltage-gated potassium channel
MPRLGYTASLILALVFIISSATVFFRFVEGWSWIDSYFFSVVTLSTVGYGQLVPVTVIGKLGTTVLIFTGLGVFALAIQHFGQITIERRRNRLRAERDRERAE